MIKKKNFKKIMMMMKCWIYHINLMDIDKERR